ncbi:Protein of unknown function [Pyronema omphalodes CBS 100304]|uniref:Uncharacterized protein n=1 Tax=Pyronema omphalodes (strain CBS 100304) TaxID=1076935 RepID=U4LE06_PYROM|nr:Protein of unknown function [Pyronema omphalodes CBS 100304]
MAQQPPIRKATPIPRPVYNALLSPWGYYFRPDFTKPFSSYTAGYTSSYTSPPAPVTNSPASNGSGSGSGSDSSSPSPSDYNADRDTSSGGTESETDISICDEVEDSASSGVGCKTSKTGGIVAPKPILKTRTTMVRTKSTKMTNARVRFNIKNEGAPKMVRGI